MDIRELQLAEKILVRERAKGDLFFFATEILGFRDFGALHKELCLELQHRPTEKTVVWLLPRAHFKTSLINEAYNLWLQLQEQRRILIASATLDIAIDMIRRLKLYLRSQKFVHYFSEIRITVPERNDQIYFEGNNWGEANFEITSPDHNIVAKHYDKIVLDDIVNGDNSTTEVQRQKVIQWFQSINGLKNKPNVPVDVIGTHWVDGDLYGHLIENLKTSHFVRGCYDPKDPENTILFPERFTYNDLQEIRRTAGESVFACQFLNDPLQGEHAKFQAKNIRYADLDADMISRHFRILVIDPAISEKADADNTAIVMMSRDDKGDIFVHGVRYGQWKTLEIIEMIYKTRDDFDPHRIGMEAEGFQRTLIHYMEAKARDEKRPVYVEAMKSGRTEAIKELRISALAPWYEGGRIWHLRDGENIEKFEAELFRFPKGRHDDMIDAASYGFNLLHYGDPNPEVKTCNTVGDWLNALDRARRKQSRLGHERSKIDDLFDFSPTF